MKDAVQSGAPNGDATSPRQREILLAAIRLFHERGYHATGMNDIGAAVGLTGPALYRHFASKEELLETALLNAARYMEQKVSAIIDADHPPRQTLEKLVTDLVHTVIEYPEVTAVAKTERRYMSDRSLAIFDRSARLRTAEWIGPLMALLPSITEAEARVRVRTAQEIVGASLLTRSSLAKAQREELLSRAALAVLLETGERKVPAPLDLHADAAIAG